MAAKKAKSPKEQSVGQRNRVIDYKTLFSSEMGKKVFGDMMKNHYGFASSFSGDPHLAAYNEGQRSVILRIMQIMKVDMAEFDARVDEAQQGYEAMQGNDL